MTDPHDATDVARAAILDGRTSLGIELGSTRIKACLVGEDPTNVERVMQGIRNMGAFKPWGSAVSAIGVNSPWTVARTR